MPCNRPRTRHFPASRPQLAIPGRIGLALVALALLFALLPAFAQDPPEPAPADDGPEPEVLVVTIDSGVHPVSATILSRAIEEADATDAAALVVELDTPGGLSTSTREMTQVMLASRVPVVVYVAPAGAQGASAGFFLLMAADIAAMAPGTNAGAAAVVGGQGEDIEGTMGQKVTEDAAAQMRSLAKRNNRPVELAEAAVLEARSFDAREALELGLIDVVEPTLPRLLQAIDGRTVRVGADGVPNADSVTLETAGAVVRRYEVSRIQRFLGILADPNIAYLLLSLGSLGLLVELYNPGSIFPGVVGAICLVLAFFALSVLPVNTAGLALLGLAAVFFIAEIKVTSYGLLSVAGVISLVIGSLMLFDSTDPTVRVSPSVVAFAAAVSLAVVLFLMWNVLRAAKQQVATGIEGMVAERGRARSDLDPTGKVFVHGEVWDAVADRPVPRGGVVEVVAVDGMRLQVRSLEPAPDAAGPLTPGPGPLSPESSGS